MSAPAELDLAKLERLAREVGDWRKCNQAWIDTSEDTPASVVGHIDEDGNKYPVATIDCDQYYSCDSHRLAKFYAAANPAVVLELVCRVLVAESRLHEVATHCADVEQALATAKDELGARTRGYEAALKEARANDVAAMGWLADCRIASGDKGKRMLPEFVEYLRELKANSDQIGELQEALRTCHLKMAHRALQFRKQLEQLKEARIGEARYEKLRKLNAQQFAELYQRNIKGEGRFDDLVDGL